MNNDDGTAKVVEYTGTSTDVIIPSTIVFDRNQSDPTLLFLREYVNSTTETYATNNNFSFQDIEAYDNDTDLPRSHVGFNRLNKNTGIVLNKSLPTSIESSDILPANYSVVSDLWN